MYNMADVITTGFALFAMLFGAGNLIFPPMLGYDLGSNWQAAAFAKHNYSLGALNSKVGSVKFNFFPLQLS